MCKEFHREHPEAYIVPVSSKGIDVWSPVWENIPYILREKDIVDRYDGRLIGIDVQPNNGGKHRPYVKNMEEKRMVFDENHRAIPGELVFTGAELTKAIEMSKFPEPFVMINTSVKNGVSAGNKRWPDEYWQELVDLLVAQDIRVIECLPDGVPKVSVAKKLKGVLNLSTPDVRTCFAIMEYSSAVITTEGAIHHAAAALDRPAVVLFGGFISPEITGYDIHTNIFPDHPDSPCGSVEPCGHCEFVMTSILPNYVFEEFMKIWV
jgi:hypothetical protein